MKNRRVVITGMGHAHPTNCYENTFFDQLEIDSSAEWVESATGIKCRYSVLSPEQIKDLSSHKKSREDLEREKKIPSLTSLVQGPWAQAKSRAGFEFSPGILICGTSIPDFHIPANANKIAEELGVTGICFDAHSACSSFVTNLMISRALIHDGVATTAAIFNVERYSIYLDYSDKRSCVLFGDGSACSLLETGEDLEGLEVIDVFLHSDSTGSDAVTIPVGGLFSQNGARVQKFAVSKTVSAGQEILKRNALDSESIAYFVGHQANLRMLKSACKRLHFSDEQHLYNVDLYGNQGAAGAPAVIASHWKKFKSRDYILVAVVGSGLTWGAALLRKT